MANVGLSPDSSLLTSAHQQHPIQNLPSDYPVQLTSNSHHLLGTMSVFTLMTQPEYLFFQIDLGDGSPYLMIEDPTAPIYHFYEQPGVYEWKLVAFSEAAETITMGGSHTVTEFIPSPWQEPKRNFDDGGLIACVAPAVCPETEDALRLGNISVLDPVYLHSGEFYLNEVDLRIPGRGFDYTFHRTYRSQIQYDGRLGHNWSHSYNQQLLPMGPDIQLIGGTGRGDLYTNASDGTNVVYMPPPGYYTELAKNPDETFTLLETDGSQAIFNPLDGMPAQGRLARLRDRHGNTMYFEYDMGGRLTQVIDTSGRPIDYFYNMDGRLDYIEDFSGRQVLFEYDDNGDLVAVTSPAVTGTPTGNDFPDGKTTRYTYSNGLGDERLNHNLTSIIAPNEVADGSMTPYLVNTYADTLDENDYNFDRVVSQLWGGTNASGVPAGGQLKVDYSALNSGADPTDLNLPRNRTTVIDRNGNQKVYEHNVNGQRLSLKEYSNREVRPGDPEFWETRYTYNQDGQLLNVIYPEGNAQKIIYDDSHPDRRQQGNSHTRIYRADPDRGGDQAELVTTWSFEPIYNQIRTVTEPRGNDAAYVPQNGGDGSAQRYTTTYIFDYEEGCNFDALSLQLGRSPNQIKQQLSDMGICTAPLGDVNGDGLTDQIAGNIIAIQRPTVTLLAHANMAAIEGANQQPIVELFTYNQFGQRLTEQDPEGNVDTFVYYSAQDPDGDGNIDNPNGNPNTGGYLKQTTRDAVSGSTRNSGTDPTPAAIVHRYEYDPVGNVIREVDGRGIATDYLINQLNQVVQTTRAAAHSIFAPNPVEPNSLTDFAYVERLFYDTNDNIVLRQVEDRGNTSNVDGNLPTSALPQYAPNPDPLGGMAFMDTLYLYDILDKPVETVQEVGDQGMGPQFLRTLTRYDANQNRTLLILPEGNATTVSYDERDLVFQQTQGALTPTSQTLLAPSDPDSYDVRGGVSAVTTYHYDGNRNLIERVDAADTDGSVDNNSDIAGVGDRTRFLYDGFDRRTSVIDSTGNQTVTQYDLAGNVVRISHFGPYIGIGTTEDGPDQLDMPVSSNGEIQIAHLVSDSLLSATEMKYDELNRAFQQDRVLFRYPLTTERQTDIADGASEIGKADLTPDDNQPIPGIVETAFFKILGRVTTRTEYDRNSRQTFMVEDDGDVSRTFYDGADREIKRVDAEGNVVESAYDDNNNLIETQERDIAQTTSVADEIFVTTYFYDSLNRLQRSVDNLGQAIDYRYDSRHNLVAMADAQGPMNGSSIVRRAFNGGTSTVNQINDFGNVTLMHYDGINRKIREERLLAQSGQGDGINMGADLFGLKTARPTVDPAQSGDGMITIRYAYDDNSLLSSQTDDNGNQTQYTYDNLDRVLSETKGVCVPPALADRCAAPTTIAYAYDPDGNVTEVTDENGSVIITLYDALNRPIRVNGTPAAGVVDTLHKAYEYDGLSRLKRSIEFNVMDDSDDTVYVTLVYDSLSRVIQESQKIGFQEDKVISSAWRAENLRTILTYPNDRVLQYRYDQLDRLQTITEMRPEVPPTSQGQNNLIHLPMLFKNASAMNLRAANRTPNPGDGGTLTLPLEEVVRYSYIGRDRVLERTYANGTQMTYMDSAGSTSGYDGLRRPVQLRHLHDNNILVGFTQSYDRMSNRLSENKLHDPTNHEQYQYDSAYRLTQFQRPEANAITPIHGQWLLDGVGNWQKVDGETRQHSSFNEIIEQNGEQSRTILYDDNGNMLDDGTYLLAWDALNRLRTVTRKSDNAMIAEYSYDAANRRVRKIVTNSEALDGVTYYYYDNWRVIEERNGDDALIQQYVYGLYIDEVLTMENDVDGDGTTTGAVDQRLFYHQNMLYSVYGLSDATGNIAEGYQYDAYGYQTVYQPGSNGLVDFGGDDLVGAGDSSVIGNPYLFTGRRLDAETGLFHYRHRYYNALLGRFISRDPLGNLTGPNPYLYVNGNPLNGMDPSGLVTVTEHDPTAELKVVSDPNNPGNGMYPGEGFLGSAGWLNIAPSGTAAARCRQLGDDCQPATTGSRRTIAVATGPHGTQTSKVTRKMEKRRTWGSFGFAKTTYVIYTWQDQAKYKFYQVDLQEWRCNCRCYVLDYFIWEVVKSKLVDTIWLPTRSYTHEVNMGANIDIDKVEETLEDAAAKAITSKFGGK